MENKIKPTEIELLELKLKIAEDALEFYGSFETWNRMDTSDLSPITHDWENIGSGRYWGKKARQALARIQGKK